MKIPRDAWHHPLLILTDTGYVKNDKGPNKCWLWNYKGLDTYLSLSYPEVYAFLQESNGQSQEEHKA